MAVLFSLDLCVGVLGFRLTHDSFTHAVTRRRGGQLHTAVSSATSSNYTASIGSSRVTLSQFPLPASLSARLYHTAPLRLGEPLHYGGRKQQTTGFGNKEEGILYPWRSGVSKD